ncbi:TetR/AcrR family transcriptional regulator C-terminal domain-containing protein [Ureibacillus sp. Re31]|uniref:TetR/AcrR family transcriptional regulator C-terminal domain-containing protein n=1 Tax=Ureibacillus galli TaxID=2762222 RepID=A0ABR8XFH7_9BACL|nr:TetR-like C-terminal domain-containing protein [Ureibacillus galli]MBD8027960.1 TetR/AcrR family transcriptional regulator C-terminal domain-containing protein [Ureibacillus galli]
MSQVDLRIIKTKEALHTALLTLLKNKPLESISISEICRCAKINRGTFYLHYSQVGDLFEEYFREMMEDLANSYQEPYRHVVKIKTSELDPSTIRIFHHIEKYKEFYRIVFSKNVPLTYYYLLFEETKRLFTEDAKEHFHVVEGIDPNFYASYQANAILGMIIQWYNDGFQQKASVLNEQLVKILNLK